MKRRPATLLAWAITVAVPLGWVIAGCSSRSGGPPPLPSLSGMVRDYNDQAAAGVPVQLAGLTGSTRLDGLLFLGPLPTGQQVLRVGDSISTPTLLVPVNVSSGATVLERPVHLPALESGIVATLPAAITTTTTVAGDQLPGVQLELAMGTAVGFPSGVGSEVRVLGVSPSRLPTRLPSGLAPRVAFLVEPHGVTFSPAATLRVPRLDPVSAGPFDAYRVSLQTGSWELVQSGLTPVGDTFQLQVTQGTLYTVVPRTPPATTTITGRIVSGTQPVPGFRASCWNLVSDPTRADGSFEIRDVPTSYGAYLVRVYPAVPGVTFALSLDATVSVSPTLGDVVAGALPADQLRPSVVSTNPADGAQNVAPRTQVVVTFSEPIDTSLPEPFRLVGSRGPVSGRINFDNRFTVRLVPAQPLLPSERYSIVVDDRVQDLTGNRLDDSRLSFSFTTRAGAPDPAPTDTQAYGISPLTASVGQTVSILGRNFTGGTTVTVGGTQTLVLAETSEEIQAQVPDFEPADDVTLSLSAGGTTVSSLRPLVLDLRASVARVLSGTTPDVPLVALERSQPPATIVVDGHNVGAATVTVDGVSVAAVDSTVQVASQTVVSGRAITLTTPAPATLLTGPVVVRGRNGQPGSTYRFLLVRE